MKKMNLLGRSALSSAVVIGAFGFAGSAWAHTGIGDAAAAQPAEQPAPQEDESDQDPQSGAPVSADGSQGPDEGSQIVVTGSRIRRPNLESQVPITTIGGEEFFETGNIAIADTLNELPQLRSTLGSQQGTSTGLGNAGLNLLDLRGLGTQRTLVLVNGRRHVAGDIGAGLFGSSVDINTLPTSLIQRVDVVTGGNSAIYGSDAIAGVVNFVTRRDFEGIEARGQAGISHFGDAGAYFASITAGTNFADDRGNVAVSVEYGRQNRYFGSNRPLASQDAFVTVDTDPAGSPNGSDGVPDTQFFRDLRSATISNTGVIVFNISPTSTQNCGTDPIGNFYTCPYIFTPEGRLVPITGTRIGLGPNGNFVGGNGENFRGGEELELSPEVDRVVANLLSHYTFSDAFELFAELKYARINSIGSGNSGPGFIISAGNGGDVRQTPRLDNPFFTTETRNFIRNFLLTSGRSTGNVGGAAGALTAADITAINNGSFRVRLQESFLGLGRREQTVERETYRAVVGARGTFNTDWNYELSLNYGEFKERDERAGNVNRQRLLLALDAAIDPANPGAGIQCRSRFDPAARTGLPNVAPGLTAAERAAILAADVAACVPANIFGGNFTQAQADYILADTFSDGKITQFVANGFVSGDTSDLFELPGGPVGFAIGAEYRRETNFFELDPISRNGYTVFNAIASLDPPPLEVKEVFGEIRIPILADIPFFEELTVTGAGRFAEYSGKTGGVFAYNAGVEWAPIRDIRVRGNYSKAVRAPALTEAFGGRSVTFVNPAPADPCSLRNRGTGTVNRAANCLALGVPADYDFVYLSTPIGISEGNPDLVEESSESYTLGAVIQPRFIPGLSLSVDYYNITVDNVISFVPAQQALNSCVDLPSIENQFCDLFQRNRGPNLGPAGEIVGRVLEGTFLITTLNFAARKARGIDFELAYRRDIEGLGVLDFRGTWTHALQRSNFESPIDPTFENVILNEVGDPQDEFLIRTNLDVGDVDFTWNMRYIGKQYIGTFEGYNSVNNLPPTNADQFGSNPFIPDTVYHNVRVGFDFTRDSEFYVGVDNLFNTQPPFGYTGIGAGSAGVGTTGIFDNRGRFYYSGVRVRF